MRPRRGWAYWAIPLAMLAAMLAAGYTLKASCLDVAWDGAQYRDYCYNDIVPLYGIRDFDQPGLPYVDYQVPEHKALEYPVLTGMVAWLAAQIGTGVNGFFQVNAAILALAAFGSLFLLLSMGGSLPQVARFAAAPSLAWAAFHNWDLLAVFFVVLAFWFHRKGRPEGVGAALALGASAKLWPAAFLPLFLAFLLRPGRVDPRGALRLTVGAAVAGLAVNLPVLFLNPEGWWWTFAFHLERGTTLESAWWLVPVYLGRWGIVGQAQALEAVPWVSMGLLVVLYAFTVFRVATGRAPIVQGCLEALLVLLITSRFFSVQYALWLLPFYALLGVSHRWFLALEGASLAVFLVLFRFFADNSLLPWVAAASVLRWALLAAFLGRNWTQWWPEDAWPRGARPVGRGLGPRREGQGASSALP